MSSWKADSSRPAATRAHVAGIRSPEEAPSGAPVVGVRPCQFRVQLSELTTEASTTPPVRAGTAAITIACRDVRFGVERASRAGGPRNHEEMLVRRRFFGSILGVALALTVAGTALADS